MKYIHVSGVSLSTSTDKQGTIWASSYTLLNTQDENTRLYILKCDSPEEAAEIAKEMDHNPYTTSSDLDDFISTKDPTVYLASSACYVIASRNLLENYFDGHLTPHQTQHTCYHVNLNTCHVTKLHFTNQNTRDQENILSVDYENDDDYSEDFLGTKKWNAHAESNPIKKGNYFPALIYPDGNDYQILWLEAKPYDGREMVSAYGCTTNQAKILETLIQYEAKKKNENNETLLLNRKNNILVASKDGLSAIFGTPIEIEQKNPGFLDKSAAHREKTIEQIYSNLDTTIAKSTQNTQKSDLTSTNKTYLHAHSIFNTPAPLPQTKKPKLENMISITDPFAPTFPANAPIVAPQITNASSNQLSANTPPILPFFNRVRFRMSIPFFCA